MAPHRHQMKNFQTPQAEADEDLDFEFTPMPGVPTPPPAPIVAASPVAPVREEPATEPAQEPVMNPAEEAETVISSEPAETTEKADRTKKPKRKKVVEEFTTTIRFPYDLFDEIEAVKRKIRRSTGMVTISTIVCEAIHDRLEYSYKCTKDSCGAVFTMFEQGSQAQTPKNCPCCGATVKRYRMAAGR